MASVLKSDQASQQSGIPTAVAFNMEDVQGRAQRYLQEVQAQADELIRQATNDAKEIREQARQSGLRDAQQEIETQVAEAAQKLSDERCRTAIQSCEAAIARITQESTKWLALWRNQTVGLACRIAEKVVRKKFVDDDELLRVWLEEAMVAMRDARDVRVMVHPDDFAVAGRFLQQLAKSIPQAAEAEVVPDPEISPGGCVARSNHGLIDQQLETQLERLQEQLS